MNAMQTLNRYEMKNIMAGSFGNSCGRCCYEHDPTNCSACISYCSGSDCNCPDDPEGRSSSGEPCRCSDLEVN